MRRRRSGGGGRLVYSKTLGRPETSFEKQKGLLAPPEVPRGIPEGGQEVSRRASGVTPLPAYGTPEANVWVHELIYARQAIKTSVCRTAFTGCFRVAAKPHTANL